MNLSTDIKYIKGIGPKRALALSKLSINCFLFSVISLLTSIRSCRLSLKEAYSFHSLEEPY